MNLLIELLSGPSSGLKLNYSVFGIWEDGRSGPLLMITEDNQNIVREWKEKHFWFCSSYRVHDYFCQNIR